MPIYLWGGEILLDGGAIAVHEDCCCGGESECAASFTWVEYENTDCLIIFTDTSTTTATGGIVSWHWDFGDGKTSEVQNTEHQYAITGGDWLVTLTITDADDNVCHSSQRVSCVCGPCGCIGTFDGVLIAVEGFADPDPLALVCQGDEECGTINGTYYLPYNVNEFGTCSNTVGFPDVFHCGVHSGITLQYQILIYGTECQHVRVAISVLYFGTTFIGHTWDFQVFGEDTIYCRSLAGEWEYTGPEGLICSLGNVILRFAMV